MSLYLGKKVMNRDTETQLLEEILTLKATRSAFNDNHVSRVPVTHYTDEAHFHAEMSAIFLTRPLAIAHVSELSSPGDFVRRDVHGRSVLITRDKAGDIRAFLNYCRHRGTRLVDDEAGCKHRFTCPYHAWTYSNAGDLLAAPHFDEGFGELNKGDLGLTALRCKTAFGFIWISLKKDDPMDFDASFDELAEDLGALDIANHIMVEESIRDCQANWKIIIEGGIESYHFKIAHKATIAPFFEDNKSTYQTFGPHMRSVLPRNSIGELSEIPKENWRLRDHANVLYTLFPNCQLLVQQDHIIWISSTPIAPDHTRLRLITLAPKDSADRKEYWAKNHAITMATLNEDFDIGDSIQSGLNSGANSHMIFGRFEGALAKFNQTVQACLGN